MNPRQVRSVLAVHQHGSIQKAAQVMHLAPSSISAQLKELSSELGVEIFIARGRNIVLSDVGLTLLPSFQALLAQEAAIREQAQRASQSLSGSLTLFAPSSMCIYRLPMIIERLQAVAPNLELLLTHEPFDYAGALKRGDIDAAILVTDSLGNGLDSFAAEKWQYQPLHREEVIYVCHPHRHQASTLTVKDLSEQALISTEPACSYRVTANEHFKAEGFAFEPRQSFSNVEVIKRCLLANMGIGLLPRCVVESELQMGQLVEQSVEGAPYQFQSCLVTQSCEVMNAKLSALWNVAKDVA